MATAEPLHQRCRERQPPCRLPPLAVEYSCDLAVGIEAGQPANLFDRVDIVTSTDRLSLLALDREGVRPAAPPVNDDFGPALLDHLEGDFLDKAGKQAFAVAVGCFRRVSDPLQRSSEVCEERRRRDLRLPFLGRLQCELRAFQRLQRGLPIPFQGRRDQAVVGVNLPIAPFRETGLVATVFKLKLLASQCRFRPGWERLRRCPRRLRPGGRHPFQEPAGNDAVDLDSAD